jgi:hypothetical protein
MENVATETGSSTTERRSRWLFALVTTSLVTVAGLVIAVQQFVLKCLWDQSAHTRTIGGVLYMLLGVVGICLPLLLFRHKRRLLSARPSRQWLLVGIPLAYMMAFALCLEASLRSTTLVLPRPFTPTAVVRYDASGSGVRIRGGWNPNLQSSSTDAKLHGGVDEFSAHLYQGFHRHPRHETITIVGRAKLLDGGAVQISLDVDAEEAIRFAVEDLADVKITRDGQPIVHRIPNLASFR